MRCPPSTPAPHIKAQTSKPTHQSPTPAPRSRLAHSRLVIRIGMPFLRVIRRHFRSGFPLSLPNTQPICLTPNKFQHSSTMKFSLPAPDFCCHAPITPHAPHTSACSVVQRRVAQTVRVHGRLGARPQQRRHTQVVATAGRGRQRGQAHRVGRAQVSARLQQQRRHACAPRAARKHERRVALDVGCVHQSSPASPNLCPQ